MIVYIKNPRDQQVRPFFLRTTEKELISRIVTLYPKGIYTGVEPKIYGVEIKAIYLPSGLAWENGFREFQEIDGIYNDYVERDRQIIDEWVKEGEEK